MQEVPLYNSLEDQTNSRKNTVTQIDPGRTPARVVEYVEIGEMETKNYAGELVQQAKAVLGLELCNKKHLQKDLSFKILRVFLDIKFNSKAKFVQLLNKIAEPDQATHFAQLFGKEVIIDISKREASGKTYYNIYDSGSWQVQPAMIPVDLTDPLCDEMKPLELPVSENPAPYRLFLMKDPTESQVNSLKGSWYEEYLPARLKEMYKAGTKFNSDVIHQMIGLSDLPEEIPGF